MTTTKKRFSLILFLNLLGFIYSKSIVYEINSDNIKEPSNVKSCKSLLYGDDVESEVKCLQPNAACMTSFYITTEGKTKVIKQCAARNACHTMQQTSNFKLCIKKKEFQRSTCHYCCTTDNCNTSKHADEFRAISAIIQQPKAKWDYKK